MINDTRASGAGRADGDAIAANQDAAEEPSLFVRHRRSERRHPAQSVTRREARM